MNRDQALAIADRIMARVEIDRAIHRDAIADEVQAGEMLQGVQPPTNRDVSLMPEIAGLKLPEQFERMVIEHRLNLIKCDEIEDMLRCYGNLKSGKWPDGRPITT